MKQVLEILKKYKKIIICGTVIVFILPLLIVHLLFKWYSGIDFLVAEWSAGDILGYIGTMLTFVGTIVLSILALQASKKANEISDRLLKLEEINSVPSLSIIEEKTIFVEYSEKMVHFKVFVKNISNGIIDIKSVSDVNIQIVLSDITETLEFVHDGLDFPTLLPGQEKQLDFSVHAHDELFKLCEKEFIRKSKCKLVFHETIEIVLGYKNAMTTYKETISLVGYGKFTVSSNISIQEQKITRSDYKLEKQEEK